jgi:hypothetical protein
MELVPPGQTTTRGRWQIFSATPHIQNARHRRIKSLAGILMQSSASWRDDPYIIIAESAGVAIQLPTIIPDVCLSGYSPSPHDAIIKLCAQSVAHVVGSNAV